MLIFQTTPDETSLDATALPMANSDHFYPPSPNSSSFGAASVILCCSAPPACSSTPLRPSVHYPIIRLVVNVVCIQKLCDYLNIIYIFHLNTVYIFDQTDLYRLEVRLELYGANSHLVVSRPSLSPSHPSTPPPSRWLALTTLPPAAKFQLVWCRMCEALRSSSFARPKHPSLLSRLYLKCRRYKSRFSLNMKVKLYIVFADTVDALAATFPV